MPIATSQRPVIAVDANPATKVAVTGTERYTREVVRWLPEVAPELDWRFYAARPAPGLGVDLTVLPFPRLWAQARLPAELARRRPDLFLDLAHVVPALCPAPALKVFHDLAFERFPGAYRPADLAYLRWTARRAARVCQTMVAVSEATRQDLISLYDVDPDRVTVVHEGGGEVAPSVPDRQADAAKLRRFGIDAPYVLSVGRIEPRKNQLTALEAVERLPPPLLLVCVGQIHDEAMAVRLDSSPRCRLLGRVSDDERDLLYRNAQTLLFPSLYEGFGLPLLDAMVHGLPALIGDRGALPELAGEAALAVDAESTEAIAAGLRRLLGDAALRKRLAVAGRRRAKDFRWNSAAERVLAKLAEISN